MTTVIQFDDPKVQEVANRISEAWPEDFGPNRKTPSGRRWSELVAVVILTPEEPR